MRHQGIHELLNYLQSQPDGRCDPTPAAPVSEAIAEAFAPFKAALAAAVPNLTAGPPPRIDAWSTLPSVLPPNPGPTTGRVFKSEPSESIVQEPASTMFSVSLPTLTSFKTGPDRTNTQSSPGNLIAQIKSLLDSSGSAAAHPPSSVPSFTTLIKAALEYRPSPPKDTIDATLTTWKEAARFGLKRPGDVDQHTQEMHGALSIFGSRANGRKPIGLTAVEVHEIDAQYRPPAILNTWSPASSHAYRGDEIGRALKRLEEAIHHEIASSTQRAVAQSHRQDALGY